MKKIIAAILFITILTALASFSAFAARAWCDVVSLFDEGVVAGDGFMNYFGMSLDHRTYLETNADYPGSYPNDAVYVELTFRETVDELTQVFELWNEGPTYITANVIGEYAYNPTDIEGYHIIIRGDEIFAGETSLVAE